LLVLVLVTCATSLAQQTPASDDSVIRIKTELVQTDLTVLDKNGQFVRGLKPEDFELRWDGKPQPIFFFERVATGSVSEARQLAAASKSSNSTKHSVNEDQGLNSDRVRTIFFYVDDTHLSAEGIARARNALSEFIDKEMKQNDHVAIVSTSGQIGFLQQLTDNKSVLRAAISRLTTKRVGEGYTGKTRITEYMASQIMNYNDKGLFAYLMESTKLEQQMGAGNRHGDHRTSSSYSAEPYLRNRLRQIEQQGRLSAKQTLTTLQGLLSTTTSLAGRKLLFVMSDGFLVQQQDADVTELLRGVTDGAAKTGTVIYTIDLRDTSSISSIDVSTNDAIDFSSRTSGLEMSERTANREPLQRMADETGGRILLNPNSIPEEVADALQESADYYLLAWRPENPEQRTGKARLNVVVRNHPDLRVRLRKKYWTPASAENTKKANSATAQENRAVELQAALGSLYPRTQAPVQLSTGYIAAAIPGSMALKLSMQIEPELFSEVLEGETKKTELDVMGAAVDDRGVISTFKQLLTITPQTLANHEPVIWHQELTVPPGLYQVRVAIRERTTGWTGSALQWIEVPDLKQSKLQMSSLFIAERKNDGSPTPVAPTPVKVSVDHSFKAGSVLRYQTYLYGSSPENLSELEVRAGVLRNDRPVMMTQQTKVPYINGANQRGMPYWSEIPLSTLTPGRYLLVVTISDPKAHSSATQQINFTIQ
jgi:VWFA-related protein